MYVYSAAYRYGCSVLFLYPIVPCGELGDIWYNIIHFWLCGIFYPNHTSPLITPSNCVVTVTIMLFHIAVCYFVLLTVCLLTIHWLLSDIITNIQLPNNVGIKQCIPVCPAMFLTGRTVLPPCIRLLFLNIGLLIHITITVGLDYFLSKQITARGVVFMVNSCHSNYPHILLLRITHCLVIMPLVSSGLRTIYCDSPL